jgi:hypothetical protein
VLEAEGAQSEGALSSAVEKANDAITLSGRFVDRDLEADALQCPGARGTVKR